MRKAIISAIAAAIIAALLFWAYQAGRAAGIRHAIEDSVIWTVTCYDPDAPEESAWGEYDQQIFIELDNNIYVHGMYQA